MNYHAILHIPCSHHAYAYQLDKLHVRLQTAKSDLDSVELIYEDKYFFEQYKIITMSKTLSDELFDYYEAAIQTDENRFAYMFILKKGDEQVYYTESGFQTSIDYSQPYLNYFQYPSIDPNDYHVIPDWAHYSVFYQIFVDRFNQSDNENFSDLTTVPHCNPRACFGGNLKGITSRLDYLAGLGINALYLTPLFESDSYHKYDTNDYYRVDQRFGTEEDLINLVDRAHQKGIRVVLDAVFNHCGIKFAPFQDVLVNGKTSRYREWFHIREFPVSLNPPNYSAFAGLSSMPLLNTANKEVQQYLLDVTEYWTKKLGIDGWRLDVSDEISHQFWRSFRSTVKAINPDALIIGENWHDARAWLIGDQFDTVMNYKVTKICVDFFAKMTLSPEGFVHRLSHLLMHNTRQVNEVLFNLLDSHDTPRFLTQCQHNISLLKSAASFLFCYIGTPCIYYGTEIGMEGSGDPDCRRPFDWNKAHWNKDLWDFFRQLVKLRKQEKALQYGDIHFDIINDIVIMTRTFRGEQVICCINRTCEKKVVGLKIYGTITDLLLQDKIDADANGNRYSDLHEEIPLLHIPAQSVRIIKTIQPKTSVTGGRL